MACFRHWYNKEQRHRAICIVTRGHRRRADHVAILGMGAGSAETPNASVQQPLLSTPQEHMHTRDPISAPAT